VADCEWWCEHDDAGIEAGPPVAGGLHYNPKDPDG
jgi:hypothetical protein